MTIVTKGSRRHIHDNSPADDSTSVKVIISFTDEAAVINATPFCLFHRSPLADQADEAIDDSQKMPDIFYANKSGRRSTGRVGG